MRARVCLIPLVMALGLAVLGGRAGLLAGAPRPARAADTPPATTLTAIETAERPDGLVITLRGDGRLDTGRVDRAADTPPRLFLDFEGVTADVPSITDVDRGPLHRIRVAENSSDPLVTRVVLDLADPSAYRIERAGEDGRDVAIVLLDAARTADADRNGAGLAMADTASPIGSLELVPLSAGSLPGDAELPPAVPAASTTEVPLDSPAAVLEPAAGDSADLADLDVPIVVADNALPQVPPAAPEPAAPESPAPEPGSEFTGHPVSLDFQDVDLRAVLRTFAEITGFNIVIDPGVEGTVDVSLREVPWDQALDTILRSNQLGYVVDGTIVRIAPLGALAAEEQQRRRLAEEQALSGELLVETRSLSYARAEDLSPLITRTALSPRGTIQVDERTNTLIITDLGDRLVTATELIQTLDVPQPQVEIEARIVQTNRDFVQDLGVEWGFTGRSAPELGNTLPLDFPNHGVVGGRLGTQGPADPFATAQEQTQTAVGLGAVNPSSAAGISLGSVNGAFNLDVALSALERTGRGRVLSTPRVSTQNNVQAEVTQGVQIPIQTVANTTVTVTFKDAALTLRVTPQITAADTVIMRIELENATPDFSREVNGIPPIDTQRALTQVLVNDGDTTVIGGIFVSREQAITERTPFLHKIPLLGWLFNRDFQNDESRELLIFITPRII